MFILMAVCRGIAEAACGTSGAEEEAGERVSAFKRWDKDKGSRTSGSFNPGQDGVNLPLESRNVSLNLSPQCQRVSI